MKRAWPGLCPTHDPAPLYKIHSRNHQQVARHKCTTLPGTPAKAQQKPHMITRSPNAPQNLPLDPTILPPTGKTDKHPAKGHATQHTVVFRQTSKADPYDAIRRHPAGPSQTPTYPKHAGHAAFPYLPAPGHNLVFPRCTFPVQPTARSRTPPKGLRRPAFQPSSTPTRPHVPPRARVRPCSTCRPVPPRLTSCGTRTWRPAAPG